MDFWKAILGLARRKIIVIPLLVSATAAALTGYFLTPLHYVSSSTMVLVTTPVGGTVAQDPTAPTGLTNPMLSFGNDLKTASTILIQAMNTPEAASQLGAVEGGPTQVTINDGRTDPNLLDGNGPFVYVAGESTSATEAKDVVVRAQKRIRQELLDRQRSLGAPPETFLTIVDVVAPTTPKVTRSVRIKVGGIALVLSFVCGLSIAYGWQARRYRRATVEQPPKHQDIELNKSADQHRLDLNSAAEESPGDRRLDVADAALGDSEQWMEGGRPYAQSPVNAEPQPADEEQAADIEPLVPAAKPAEQHAAELEPSPNLQPADEEQAADIEPLVPAAKPAEQHAAELEPSPNLQPADEEQMADIEPLVPAAKPAEQHAAEAEPSPEPEEVEYRTQQAEGWDLYIVDYPPANREASASAGDGEFDWNWEWAIDGLESERSSEVVGRRRSH